MCSLRGFTKAARAHGKHTGSAARSVLLASDILTWPLGSSEPLLVPYC